MKKLYIKVTRDKYELPVAVADSPTELARIVGTTPGSILSSITHNRGTYFRLYIEDDEETE